MFDGVESIERTLGEIGNSWQNPVRYLDQSISPISGKGRVWSPPLHDLGPKARGDQTQHFCITMDINGYM